MRQLLKKRVAYLSGAPRVSTSRLAVTYGPRNHILGTIEGFRENGWEVGQYIAGDHLLKKPSQNQFGDYVGKSEIKLALVDAIRLSLNPLNKGLALARLGIHWDSTYERYGLFQGIGHLFKRFNVPWILETNEVYYKEAAADRNSLKFAGLAKQFEARAYQNCDILVTISESLKQNLIEEFKLPPDKVLVLPNGFASKDVVTVSPVKAANTFNIVFVGLLTEWIGVHTLLEALPKTNLPIKVTICGDGPFKKTLQQKVEILGVAEQVHFAGFVPRPKLYEYIDGADIGYSGHIPLSTTRFHSPMKLYEYMGRGLPVISSDDEDGTAMLAKGNFGFLFRRNDPDSLAQTLTQAFAKRADWPQMGTNACREIRENHTWKARVALLETVMQDFRLFSKNSTTEL